jgi:hypothetical protein
LNEQFSTYYGGTNEELVRDVAIDASGNLYLAGSTRSPNYRTSAGAYDPSFDQSGNYHSDAFVTKLSSSGSLVWSTLIGGPNFERIYGIEVDDQGFVYVAGRAGPGLAVTSGALQTTFGGSINSETAYGPQDGFVCKLTPGGNSVVFCTYFGNGDYVPIRDIAIDANHDIYVVSSMVAVDTFPSAWFANSYQSQVRGGRDALVAKIRGDGSGVAWATFLGGSGDEGNTNTVMVDGSGVYVAMFTLSPDAPTPNGFDHTLSGHSDIYLAKLTLDGSRLLYATYIGGSGGEDTETHQLALDAQGNAFVAVPSSSSDAPTTSGAYQTRFGGGLHDVLVAKVASDGHLVAATYVGGSGNDWAEGVDVDAAGNVYFTGATDSPNFPTSGGQGPGGSTDIIAVALSNNLSKLNFSRRLGGSGNERGRTVAATAKGFFVGGQTDSPNWPTRLPIQSSLGGDLDGVVTDFVPAP